MSRGQVFACFPARRHVICLRGHDSGHFPAHTPVFYLPRQKYQRFPARTGHLCVSATADGDAFQKWQWQKLPVALTAAEYLKNRRQRGQESHRRQRTQKTEDKAVRYHAAVVLARIAENKTRQGARTGGGQLVWPPPEEPPASSPKGLASGPSACRQATGKKIPDPAA